MNYFLGQPIFLYIDPGTGSMLFVAILGVLSSLHFFLKKLWMKIKYSVGAGDKAVDTGKKDVVIFSEGKQYAYVFKDIVKILDKKGIKAEYWTTDEHDEVLKDEYENVKTEYIGEGNRAFVRLNSMDAKLCLSTTPGLEVYQWKRSKKVDEYAHIFHSIDEGLAYRMFGIDFYDTILGVGEFQKDYIRRIEEMRCIPEKHFEVVGCTYMDELLARKLENDKNAASGENAGGPVPAPRTILLAPSWGESSVLNKYGSEMIDALVGTGYNVIIRPHPQSLKVEKDMIEGLKERYKDNARVEWDFDKNNYNSLSRADVLISDFSSVVFDFAFIFNKSVIYTDITTDVSVLDESWLEGETLWRYKVVDDIGTMVGSDRLADIKKIIDDLIEKSDVRERREKFKNETWANQGSAAEKVAEYIEKKVKEQPAVSAEAVTE